MSISNKCTESLIWLYKKMNQRGLLDKAPMSSLYISSYFTYKKYLEDSYSRLSKYHGYLFKGGNILDVGANIGYTAFVFSKVIDEFYKIVAFEPEIRNIALLKQASKKYLFSDKLISVATAVGDTEGEIELWQNETHNGDHRILTPELKKKLKKDIKIQKINIISLDSYVKNFDNHFPVAFIKIDVQGYELAVCRGMEALLFNNPNAVIGLEYCPSIIESLGYKPEELIQFFQNKGYQFFYLTKKNKIKRFDVNERDLQLRKIRPHDYLDLLCSRKNLECR